MREEEPVVCPAREFQLMPHGIRALLEATAMYIICIYAWETRPAECH